MKEKPILCDLSKKTKKIKNLDVNRSWNLVVELESQVGELAFFTAFLVDENLLKKNQNG